jgi:2-polyprenyl-6-hydroxyphenyl methylase/3-demethylubiquinone-9 3-methyltransferase
MINADPQELAKFSDLAHKWWDPESEFRPLHQINPLRLDWIDQLASIKGKNVVDVGCGGGILAESMARRGANVLGIDLADKPLKVAQLHAMEAGVANLDYRSIAAEALANEQPGQFDVVTCMEMLEHVPDPTSVIQACADMVKPGGWVFFSTLNRNPKSYLFAIVGAEYLLKLLPKGTHEFSRFIRPAELARWIREARLDTVQFKGHGIQPSDPPLQAVGRHQRELPGGVPQAHDAMSARPLISPDTGPTPAQAVLFDLDGTLADTAGDLVGAVNQLRVQRGLAATCRWRSCAPTPRQAHAG